MTTVRHPTLRARTSASVAAIAITALLGGVSLNAQAHHNDKAQQALASQLDASGTIVDNAAKVKDLSTLVTAVKAAGLVDTLSGPGPFTVFAPSNEAFAALPAGTVDTLLKPENKAQLTGLLTYHVVPGSYSADQLAEMAGKSADKTVMVKTVEGESLKLTDTGKGGHWTVTDAKGNTGKIVFKDLKVANGTVYTVDKVLMP